ncbi:MAG: Ig-like domain-containing protein [Alistipes sp.]|nr:Ig-like domain-containing protein [Alistipes sp.]
MSRRHNIQQRITTALSAVIVLLFVVAIFTKCASTMTPTGGPKDTIPPVIVYMNPDNFTTNIDTLHPPKIYVEFDEYVQIKDLQKELYTSPAMKKQPKVVRRGRGIEITIVDTLRPDITYAINFGAAIRDNNEGNPLNAMRYVFSTGDTVDSMYMSGYTEDSYKADSVSKSFIYFYAKDSIEQPRDWDSTIFKYKPQVIARAENNGIFIAQNLKPIEYRVYAFQDTNNNMEYEPSVDKIGFIDSTFNPMFMPDFTIWYDSLRHYPSAEPQLYFRMFTDRRFVRQTMTAHERTERHKATLYFSAEHPQVRSIHFDSIPDDKVIYDPQTRGRDTVALWFNLPAEQLPDTIRGEITYFKHDSIGRLVPVTEKLRLAWKYEETKEERKAREELEKQREKALKNGEEWEEPEKENPFKVPLATSGEVNKDKHIDLEFAYPLTTFDSTRITMRRMVESDTIGEAVRFHFVHDTLNYRKYQLRAQWEAGYKYELMIPSGVFGDVAQQQNDTIKATYTASDPAKYATVNVKVRTTKSQARYILQLTNAQGKAQKEIFNATAGDYKFEYVSPGDVMLRVVEDMNGNGRWDSGDMVARRQPERSEINKNEEGVETITTKENWEFDIDVDMDKLFAPITMESVVKMLNDREDERLKKVAKELEEKRKKEQQQGHNHGGQGSSGMGFGGIGGMGGLGGSTGGGGLRSGTGNMGGMGGAGGMGGNTLRR